MMPDKVIYEFAVIRVVPKVEREEFVNVGVMVFCKGKKYIGIKYKIDEQKIKAFSAEIDIDFLNNYLNAWDLVCQGNPQGGRIGELDQAYRFRWLTASRSTIIQSSPTHTGLCLDPEKILKDLFELYVL